MDTPNIMNVLPGGMMDPNSKNMSQVDLIFQTQNASKIVPQNM